MLDHVNLHFVNSLEKAQELLRWLSQEPYGVKGIDTETTGLSPEEDTIRLVQFGDKHTGWALPYPDWRGLVAQILEQYKGTWVAHNAKFDVSMLEADNLTVPRHRVEDTRYMAHIINPLESTALKRQAALHVDKKAAAAQRILDDLYSSSGYTWKDIPIVEEGPLAVYWIYGALDPVLTCHLYDHYKKKVETEAPQAYDLELSVAWIINDMERRGAKVNREFTQARQTEYSQALYQLGQDVYSQWGITPGSRQGVIRTLEKDGIELTLRSERTGELSLGKDALAPLNHPLAQAVLRHRKLEKITNTYLNNFLKFSAYDGFIHPSINVIGGSNRTTGESGGEEAVKTSRMSMSGPNLQNLPRPVDEELASVRSCIVPREESNSLLTIDFDQIEMRILAHQAKDKGMIDAFLSPEDFFVSLAKNIYRDQSITKSDPRRNGVKAMGYAKIYVAGLQKLSTMLGVPVAEVKRVSQEFDDSYPGAKRFGDMIAREASENYRNSGSAYVRSPFTGRKYVVEDRSKIYQLNNYRIQGPAAELLKMKILELDAAGLGEFMILPVHDEMILDVPDTQVREVAQTMHDVMNDDKLLDIPITAGLAKGKDWGTKEDYEL